MRRHTLSAFLYRKSGILLLPLLFLQACNNNSTSSNTVKDSAATASIDSSDQPPAELSPTLTSIAPATSTAIKALVDNYLQVKNDLAADHGKEAAAAAQTVYATLTSLDTTTLTPEQKTLYSKQASILKEESEKISSNTDIEQQRSHFALLSNATLVLVKGFGGGRTLYQDHCPMYNEDKGADWLSETADIKNPYLGSKMPDCGTVEAKIK